MTTDREATPTAVVVAARRRLGPVGVLLPAATPIPTVAAQCDGVRRLEAAGYRAGWVNEVVGGGKDALVQLALLLSATQQMAFGTSIANIWARPPQTAHGAGAMLAQAFPDRFVLGLGVGYPQQAAAVGRDFGRPIATMRNYLEQMAAEPAAPGAGTSYPRIVGATGPAMLSLAGSSADGALPAMLPVEFTARARQVLGPDKLLVVGVPVVADDDRTRARATARQAVAGPIAWLGSYPSALADLGYSGQEIAEVDDRLVDAVVASGDGPTIAAALRAHLDAGADHVMIMPTGVDTTDAIIQPERLAPSLAHLP